MTKKPSAREVIANTTESDTWNKAWLLGDFMAGRVLAALRRAGFTVTRKSDRARRRK